MTIQDRFSRFLANVDLDQGRKDRIASAVSRLVDFCRNDASIRQYTPHIFYQGSYANGLAIKPARAREEYDVDLVILMSLPNPTAATRALDWFQDRLATDADYRGRIIQKDKCVRLNYAGDFHVDVVPAHRKTDDAGVIQIPSRTHDWQDSHPKGFTAWCQQQDRRTANDFSRAVRMLKRWRDITGSARTSVPSIIFTTLLGPRIPASPRTNPDALVIASTLNTLNQYLVANPYKPPVSNPSLPAENLAASWTQTEYSAFQGQIAAATALALSAYNATDELTGARRWRQLFGDDFPIS